MKSERANSSSSEPISGSAVRASKRRKTKSSAPPSEPHEGGLGLAQRGHCNLDVFTQFLEANLLRCDDVMFDKWAWVKAAPFIPFPRHQMPRILAQSLYDICQALNSVIGLELLSGVLQVPRDQVLATVMASTVGFTSLWVKTLGMLPPCNTSWDRAWKDTVVKRLMQIYIKRDHDDNSADLFDRDISVIRSRSHLGAKSAKEARQKVEKALAIVDDI